MFSTAANPHLAVWQVLTLYLWFTNALADIIFDAQNRVTLQLSESESPLAIPFLMAVNNLVRGPQRDSAAGDAVSATLSLLRCLCYVVGPIPTHSH